MAYLGTGFANVTLALVLLAIPPILTNTYVAVTQVEGDTVDAARGMGMTGAEIVRKVELPLALPLIFGGVRISAVNVVATATVAPLAGIDALGDPIIDVSSYGDRVPGRRHVVAALAIFTELTLGAVQRAVTPAGLKLDPTPRHGASDSVSGGKQRREEEPPSGRALALLLMLTASFTIAACGEDDEEGSSTGAATGTTDETAFAIDPTPTTRR